MKIVFLDRETIPANTRLRELDFAHEWLAYGRTASHEVMERIADADIVIINKVKLSAEVLANASKLKSIAVAATGTDNIDLEACQQLGIVVSNVRNYAMHTVPEHTFALIFALRRSICAYRDAVKAGRWQEAAQFCFFDHPIRDLAGSTLGIIGDGVLGQSVAKMGRALGMRVLFSAHKGRSGQGRLYTPFEEVLHQADVLTLHCPYNAQTRHMIGAAEFAQMARKPLLINTGRGGLVDEASVGPALLAGHISGAAFDVTSVEPPPADHPFMALLDRPDFILTPHVAWASAEAVQALADQLMDNIEAFVNGAPVNTVRSKAR
jgi:glycerate dehydrogenase